MSEQNGDVTPRRANRRRIGRRGRWAIGIAAGCVVVGAAWVGINAAGGFTGLLTGAAGKVMTMTHTGGKAAQNGIAYRSGDPITVLVMGTEVAPSYAAPQLTDSMMLMSLDPKSHTASVMSIPRDLWIDIPGEGYQRINTALENTGPAGAELTVEKYFGVPVEYYAIVNYTSLVKLVNLVGGIEVNVPHAINDTCFPNPLENQCTTLRIAAGLQHMNGQLALDFARERHSVPGEDLGRESDQQLVLFALKHALLKPGNLLKLPQIIGTLSQTVQTNLPAQQLPQLAEEALQLKHGDIHSTVLSYSTGAVTPYTTAGSAAVLLPNLSVIHQEAATLFSHILGHLGGSTVQVFDGAPTTQPLATYFSNVLDGMGVTTLKPETAPQTNHKASAVYANTAVTQTKSTLAYMLAEMLGVPLKSQRIANSQADVVVVLGANFPAVSP